MGRSPQATARPDASSYPPFTPAWATKKAQEDADNTPNTIAETPSPEPTSGSKSVSYLRTLFQSSPTSPNEASSFTKNKTPNPDRKTPIADRKASISRYLESLNEVLTPPEYPSGNESSPDTINYDNGKNLPTAMSHEDRSSSTGADGKVSTPGSTGDTNTKSSSPDGRYLVPNALFTIADTSVDSIYCSETSENKSYVIGDAEQIPDASLAGSSVCPFDCVDEYKTLEPKLESTRFNSRERFVKADADKEDTNPTISSLRIRRLKNDFTNMQNDAVRRLQQLRCDKNRPVSEKKPEDDETQQPSVATSSLNRSAYTSIAVDDRRRLLQVREINKTDVDAPMEEVVKTDGTPQVTKPNDNESSKWGVTLPMYVPNKTSWGGQEEDKNGGPRGAPQYIPRHKRQQVKRKWRNRVLLALLFVVCVITIIVLASALRNKSASGRSQNSVAGKQGSSSGSTPDDSPPDNMGDQRPGEEVTLEPVLVVPVETKPEAPQDDSGKGNPPVAPPVSVAPPQKGSPFAPTNDQCTDAISLTGNTYFGSTVNATMDVAVNTCDNPFTGGHGVWYVFESTKVQTVKASTCDGTNFDTQLVILSGTCENLSCVAFNDQFCGDQSEVSWFAESDTTYFVLVQGYRGSRGNFTLQFDTVEENDVCEDAEGPLETGSVSFGTTRAASVDNVVACDGVDLSAPGVWYYFIGEDEWLRANAATLFEDFIPQISVYSGNSCGTLQCEAGGTEGAAWWRGTAGVVYYVLVNGQNGKTGDFELNVAFGLLPGPDNDACELAIPFEPSNVAYTGSTNFARPTEVVSCGNKFSNDVPGVWFVLEGTGEAMTASTCSPETDFDTEIYVFRGTCNDLECVGENDQDALCGDRSTVTWFTNLGETYFVFLTGHTSRTGNFWLTIENSSFQVSQECMAPIPLSATDNAPILGMNIDSPRMTEFCTGDDRTHGVWYDITGTGNDLTASTCNPETNFPTLITVLTGGCNALNCVATKNVECGEQTAVSWASVEGIQYHIFVHGASEQDLGGFHLSIADDVVNDDCSKAVGPLMPDGSKTLGSSSLGSMGDTMMSGLGSCSASLESSPSVWYFVEGTGLQMSASTCSDDTDFDTQIFVFTGECGDLECIASADDNCGKQSIVTWDSVLDQRYYILIRGFGRQDAGSFALEIA